MIPPSASSSQRQDAPAPSRSFPNSMSLMRPTRSTAISSRRRATLCFCCCDFNRPKPDFCYNALVQVRPRAALNAQLLRFNEGYRSAGIARYIYHLLRELPDAADDIDLNVYATEPLAPTFLTN